MRSARVGRVVVGVGGVALEPVTDQPQAAQASGQTLAWAVSEASATGRRLLICHACPPDSALAAPGAGSRMSVLELSEPALARAIAAARLRLGGDRVGVLVRSIPPGQMLVAESEPADLLVVGAPTRTGWFDRRSTTHHVVLHAPGSVIVVRPDARSGGAHPLLAGHVVVGVDGSAASRAALEFAFGFAAEHRRPVAAVHVEPRLRADLSFDDRLRELHVAAEPVGLALLGEEVEPWQHKYPEVAVKRAVFGGRASVGLSRAARGAFLLCVGVAGRGVASAWPGSVVRSAIDHAPCPVAVVQAGQVDAGVGAGQVVAGRGGPP